MSTTEYGPLNIPNSFLTTEGKSRLASSPAAVSPYNLVTFNNPISVRSDVVNLPITLYGQSYTAVLTKSQIDSGIDGMDGYTGTIPGQNNSQVIMVVMGDNLVTATIQLEDDYLIIDPAQNRTYTENTQYPLHVIYSENDLVLPTEPINFCGTQNANLPVNQSVFMQNLLQTRSVSALPLDITFVTDREYYGSAGNWESKAYSLLLAADEYFIANGDLNIILRAQGYDSSQREVLSSSPFRITNPLSAAESTFSTSYINGKHSDIFVYLGGNDQYNPQASQSEYVDIIGESDFPPHGRIAWVQMVPNIQADSYDASTYATTYCFNHELGHMFSAQHNVTTSIIDGGFLRHNVMHVPYYGRSANGRVFCDYSIQEMLPYRVTVTSYW